jgi:hypothetical protein
VDIDKMQELNLHAKKLKPINVPFVLIKSPWGILPKKEKKSLKKQRLFHGRYMVPVYFY